MKNFEKTLYIFLAIFAVAFLIPVIFCIVEAFTSLSYKKIVNNGIETIAYVNTDNPMSSNLTVNEVKYYQINYYFEVDGQVYYGSTSSNYTLSRANEILSNGSLKIKYIRHKNTYKSIESNYTSGPANTGRLISLISFGLIDAIIWCIFIIKTVKAIQCLVISKKGTIKEATFVSSASGVVYNNVPMYHINYVWTNDSGKTIEGSSADNYTKSEADLFEQIKVFAIKTIGNKSIVESKPFQLSSTFKEKELSDRVEKELDNKFVECEYCHSTYDIKLSKCPTCGAPKNLNNAK